MKGKKRKLTKDEKIEAIMTSMVIEVVNSQRESNKLFFEMEEKRMNFTNVMKHTAHSNYIRYIFNIHVILLQKSPPSCLKSPKWYLHHNTSSAYPVVKKFSVAQ